MANIFFLDNFDSFIYNLVDQLRKRNHEVIIFRNNVPFGIILENIKKIKNPIIMLSPGPGTPKNAGCMIQLLKNFKGKIPFVGICLGYQAIIEIYGGVVKSAEEILHGKCSLIEHDKKAMFSNIPNPFLAARYHSLIGTEIPYTLTVNANVKKIPMAVRNNKDLICGFQFHPESILTTYGTKILDQTIKWITKLY